MDARGEGDTCFGNNEAIHAVAEEHGDAEAFTDSAVCLDKLRQGCFTPFTVVLGEDLGDFFANFRDILVVARGRIEIEENLGRSKCGCMDRGKVGGHQTQGDSLGCEFTRIRIIFCLVDVPSGKVKGYFD